MTASRVALVTGASRGIGAAIAAQLAADGLFVIGTATSEDGARRIGEALGEGGAGAVLRVDDDEAAATGLRLLDERFPPPTVLVNNAGIARDGLLLRMTAAQWAAVVDANLNGLYRVTRPLLRGMMRARWGRIVNVSSVVARMGNAGQANYAASKAGIEGFSRALAREVGSRGITVNAVAPGFVATDMTADLPPAQRDALLAQTALGRLGTPADVAGAVSFLASDAAAYVTGETLHVNGGLFSA